MTIAFCVPYNLISFKNFGIEKNKTIKTHVRRAVFDARREFWRSRNRLRLA